jgi:ABC-type dipeptide/oligopeptide/nickel transport system permease subunit
MTASQLLFQRPRTRSRTAGRTGRIRRTFLWPIGLASLVAVIFIVAIGPALVGQDPYAISAQIFAPWSAQHWLGTDELGRDVASRIANGGRVDLGVAAAADALSTVAALLVGIFAGYFGGWIDLIVTRLIDLFFAVPSLLLALSIVALLGPSASTVIIAVAAAYWAWYARLIRAEVVAIRGRPHVDAARIAGSSPLMVVWRDILPGLRSMILINSTALIGWTMLDAAALGFLGLGIQPPEASWGAMLADSRQFFLSHPSGELIAAVPIILTVLAANVIADAIRDRIDARESGL